MTDVPDDPAVESTPDEWWTVEVDHSAYYRWLPVRDEDIPADLPADQLIEATWPGFHLMRATVNEPTTTSTRVHVASLHGMNDERKAAGLAARPPGVNLARHLEDGPWPKHFPLDSITAVRCDEPAIQAALTATFVTTGGQP